MDDINSFVIWDLATEEFMTTSAAHKSFVYSLSWNSRLDLLASASGDGIVRIWDTETLEPVLTIDDPQILEASVAWSPDGRLLVSGGWGGMLRLWRIYVPEDK